MSRSRPPLEELAAAAEGAGEAGDAFRRAALRLRPLVDAAEQHALDAVGVSPGLYVAVDALAGAGLRTLAAAEQLAARPPGHVSRCGPAGRASPAIGVLTRDIRRPSVRTPPSAAAARSRRAGAVYYSTRPAADWLAFRLPPARAATPNPSGDARPSRPAPTPRLH